MIKHRNAGLTVIAAGLSLLIAGCGGGGSSSSGQTAQRFAGSYTGAYLGIGSTSGNDISGVFSGTADNSGVVGGTVTQDGGGSASTIGGQITSSGGVNITASGSLPTTPVITFNTLLSGNVFQSNNDLILGGTLATTQSNGDNPRGGFVAIRTATTVNSFAGTYSGTVTGRNTSDGVAFTGTLALTVSQNGLIRGTYARSGTNVRVRPMVGTVNRTGVTQLFALAEVESTTAPGTFNLVTTQLNGTASTSNGTRISGTLLRSGGTSVNATGTFSITRTATTN